MGMFWLRFQENLLPLKLWCLFEKSLSIINIYSPVSCRILFFRQSRKLGKCVECFCLISEFTSVFSFISVYGLLSSWYLYSSLRILCFLMHWTHQMHMYFPAITLLQIICFYQKMLTGCLSFLTYILSFNDVFLFLFFRYC